MSFDKTIRDGAIANFSNYLWQTTGKISNSSSINQDAVYNVILGCYSYALSNNDITTGSSYGNSSNVGYVLTATDLLGGASWQAVAATASGANPTASVGTSAINGTASTFMRSDGAPAISQTIVPVWTGVHTFNQANIQSTPTDGVILGNTTVTTSGTIPVQESAALNWQGHVWNTGGSNNILNARMYTRGASGSGPTNTLLIDFSFNGGAYTNQFAFSGTGGFTAGSVTTFGIVTAGSLIVKPGGGTAINTTATTITAAAVAGQLLTSSTVAAVAGTLPSASSILTQLNGGAGTTSILQVINTGPNTFTVTLPASIVASTIVTGGNNLVVAAAGATPTIATFLIVWSTTSAALIYRIG